MRVLPLVLCAALNIGCRDLELPTKQVGRVSGLAMFTDEQGLERPAVGAEASVAGTSLRVTATNEGAFALSPIVSSEGELVIRFDVDGDGTFDLARSLDFATWGIGPNHDASLGRVSLRSTATLTGLVALEGVDVISNAGIDVYVPGLPLATSTTDTGAFVLRGVPEGSVAIAASKTGYVTKRVDSIAVRSGELLNLAKFSLAPTAARQTVLTGSVEIEGGALSEVTVTALSSGAPIQLDLDADGRFRGTVTSGRVTVVARAPGFSDAVQSNVVVQAERVDVGVLRLNAGAYSYSSDGGARPTTNPRCGDGVVNFDEICDDANVADGDGCSSGCKLEPQVSETPSCVGAPEARLCRFLKVGTRRCSWLSRGRCSRAIAYSLGRPSR